MRGVLKHMLLLAGVVIAQSACSSHSSTLRASTAPTTSTTGETTTTAPPAPSVATTIPVTPTKVAVRTTAVSTGSIYGSIGAGAGGKGTADLSDDAGRTWHRDADAYGAYRFDALAPGHYLLTLSASSAPPPCSPGGPCLGPAFRANREDIQLAPGERHRTDMDAYGPTHP